VNSLVEKVSVITEFVFYWMWNYIYFHSNFDLSSF